MQDRGSADFIHVYQTSRTFEGSFRSGRDIFSVFDQPDQPTAIYATTDAIAVGVLQAAFQMGIQVPAQVSIVGFDDIDIAEYMIPPLTTVRQSGFEMGQVAAELLFDMIEQEQNSDQVEDVILTPSLMVRQSAAPPKNL
jgi:LacI family transcriptional regulator